MLKDIDIIAAGELLIDFISADFAENLDEVSQFKKLPGGSPANLAANLARLGKRVSLVSAVGQDDMGDYLARYVADLGLDTAHLARVALPTTLILVTRSRQVSNFEAYRMADTQLGAAQFPPAFVARARLFHTTCFALSLEPARSSILTAAAQAHDAGAQLSIDVNYAAKIWPDQREAQRVVADYCSRGAMVKCSEVDWERLYGHPLHDNEAAATHFLAQGASIACLTLGNKGCYVSNGAEAHFLPSRPVAVRDTTGAGDAFWSGFLSAWLDGAQLLHCAMSGRKMAERKLEHFGPLPGAIPARDIYVDWA